MSCFQDVKSTITDITGINLKNLNIFNLGLCIDPLDAANKNYVDSRNLSSFTNIGIGASFYSATQGSTFLFRSIPTSIATSYYSDNTSIYSNTSMFHSPYPQKTADTTTLPDTYLATGPLFNASILAPNGKIYCAPGVSTSVLIIDPYTNITDTTSIPFAGANAKYASSSLAKNGKIYCVPRFETRVLIIDTKTNTIDTTSVNIPGLNGNVPKWHSSVINTSGILYGIPRQDTRVIIINTNTNNYSFLFVSQSSFVINYTSSCLAPNGKIYCPPFNTTSVLIIDTNTNICDNTTFSVSAGNSFHSACLTNSDIIYCFPFFSSRANTGVIMSIDTKSNVFDSTTLNIPVTSNGIYGAAKLGMDDRIYAFPVGPTGVLVFDPSTRVSDITSVPVFPSSTTAVVGYTTATLAPNGKIYAPPWQSSKILIVNTGIPQINSRLCLSLSQNKG